jgi:hypothetical protein
MSQGPIRTTAIPASNLSKNYSANSAGDQIKTGPGVLVGLTINTVGVTSSITLYDGTDNTGKKLGSYSTLALADRDCQQRAFTTGLFAVLAGGTPADVTVTYR